MPDRPDSPTNPSQPVTRDKAVEIARFSASEHATFSRDAPAVVEETDDDLIVTFPTNHPVGVRGADFHARVVIDKLTGKVKEILGGP